MKFLPDGPKNERTWILVAGLTLIIVGFWKDKDIITILSGIGLVILSLFWIVIKGKLDKMMGYRIYYPLKK